MAYQLEMTSRKLPNEREIQSHQHCAVCTLGDLTITFENGYKYGLSFLKCAGSTIVGRATCFTCR